MARRGKPALRDTCRSASVAGHDSNDIVPFRFRFEMCRSAHRVVRIARGFRTPLRLMAFQAAATPGPCPDRAKGLIR